MTTPERVRRRQRIETALVAATMALSAVSMFVLSQANERQDRCVAQQITDLTSALNTRSASTGRLNEATADVITSFAVAGAKSKPGQSEAERRKNSEPILKALVDYAKVQAEVRRDRQGSPFPPFPTGKCD